MLKAFNVNPAALIKQAAGSASIRDLGEKTSLRMAFANEFNDVTRALDHYRLVIFIDDLDRCNPGSVTQILESVNFLTSAGECFVVMGLAKAQVAASVGLSFKDVAEELGDGADAKEKRRVYAQQYLRKLINLEVRVPTATPEQQLLLLEGGGAEGESKPKTYAERLSALARANRPVAWVAVACALAIMALHYGMNLELPETPKAKVTVGPEPTATPTPKATPIPIPRITPAPLAPPTLGPAFFEGAREAQHLVWLPVFAGLVFVAFIAWSLTRRPNEIIRDSKNFTDALEIWQPVIGPQCRTPREIKRFLNLVRYIAMRWRKPSNQETLLERLANRFHTGMRQRLPAPEDAIDSNDSNEAGIVLMAALDGLGGERVSSSSNAWPEVQFAKDKHIKRFGASGTDWRRYREITGEVETN
jgi:hypothetical protein